MPVTSLCHYLQNGPASSTPFYVVPALPQLPARQVSAIQSADSTRMAVAVGNSVELIRLAESVAWIPRLKWRQDHRGAVVVRARNSPGAPAMGAYTDLNYRGHTARDRLGARRHLAPVRLGPLESRCKISLLQEPLVSQGSPVVRDRSPSTWCGVGWHRDCFLRSRHALHYL